MPSYGSYLSINRWIDKEDVVFMHNWLLLSHKKKESNLAICGNMDGPGGYYAMWNKSDREKRNTEWFHFMWNLKNKWTNRTEQEQTHK